MLVSSLLRRLFGSSALVARCHTTALLHFSFVCIFGRSFMQCQLFVPGVPMLVIFSLRVSSALVFCPAEFDPSGYRRLRQGRPSPLCFARESDVASSCLLLSTNGASGCGSFSVLCSADVAFLRAACSSGGTLW